MPDIRDEMIYRVRDYSASEHVRLIEIDKRKNPRYVVEFLNGENAGAQENVPGVRLRGPWSDVDRYDALMANWERIAQVELTDPEESAALQVFSLLIPEEVAKWDWSPVRYAVRVRDGEALQAPIGITVDDLLAQAEGSISMAT